MATRESLRRRPPRGHRFTIQVTGLSNEEAARFYVALIAMAEASPGERGSCASNVPIAVLRQVAPDDEWVLGYVPSKVRYRQ